METAVVTGTSTGIGFATSVHLARHGCRVFAGMRNLGKAGPLRAAAAAASLPIEVIQLDVTSTASVSRAFETLSEHGPYQPIMRRNGKLFAAGLCDPTQPDDVAKTILAAITSDEYRLRWPVGKDALGFSQGRPKIKDECWVAMGDDLSDQPGPEGRVHRRILDRPEGCAQASRRRPEYAGRLRVR